MLHRIEHPRRGPMRVWGNPLNLTDSPHRQLDPAPGLGEHTRQVLAERLGLSEAELDTLTADGVI